MRYVVVGAGAIGGALGGMLHAAGREVVLVARGAHLEAIRRDGLALRTPEAARSLAVPVVGHPDEIAWRDGDVIVLATKSQDSQTALEVLRDAISGSDVPVLCAQNGVANERLAQRFFSRVYGMMVWALASHLRPGEVVVHSRSPAGALALGRHPRGLDALGEAVAADLSESGFLARADADVMRLKHAKLLTNLGNVVQALCGAAAPRDIASRARDEALEVYGAAAIDSASVDDLLALVAPVREHEVPGIGARPGGSMWQSLARGRSLETDYLNGEIALLGALAGVPTPVNRTLQAIAAELAREGREPGTYDVAALIAQIDAAVGAHPAANRRPPNRRPLRVSRKRSSRPRARNRSSR